MRGILDVDRLADETAMFLREQRVSVKNVVYQLETINPIIIVNDNIEVWVRDCGEWNVIECLPDECFKVGPARYTMQMVLTDVQELMSRYGIMT